MQDSALLLTEVVTKFNHLLKSDGLTEVGIFI
jgi:hypothetical protein